MLYHTLIEPYFRYCSIVWGQCGEALKDKLQSLQNQTARTIAKLRYDEANHYELLTEFGWLSVRNLISLDTAIFVYKEIDNLHPEQAHSPFQRLDYLHSYSMSLSVITRGPLGHYDRANSEDYINALQKSDGIM